MEKVKISIELGEIPDETGMLNVWCWCEHTYNTEWKPKKPFWEFLNSKQSFMIAIGETIEIDKSILEENFELVG